MDVKRIISFWKEVVQEASRQRISRMSAALAFYGLFAVPPLLIVALMVAGTLFGDAEARDGVLEQVEALGGETGRKVAADMIESMPKPGSGAPVTQLMGALALFFAATAGFKHLRQCLEQIAGSGKKPTGLRILLAPFKRLFGFGLVVLFSIVLLGVGAMSVALDLSPDSWIARFPAAVQPFLSTLIQRASMFLVAFLGLGLIYKVLPNGRVPWRTAIIGAFLAATLLLALRAGMALYLQHSWRNVAFGAAGSVVAILITFYAAAAVVLLGAIVGVVYVRRQA